MKLTLASTLTIALATVLQLIGGSARAQDITKSYYYSAPNPFSFGKSNLQCTSYAWGRAYEATGRSLSFQPGSRNGGYWYDRLDSSLERGSTPRANSIISWKQAGNAYGHVAYVEKYYSADDSIDISEANWASNSLTAGRYDGWRHLSSADWRKRGINKNFICNGFVYLRAAQANRPSVINWIQQPTSTGGTITISFSASDPDGDSMGYDIYLFNSSGAVQVRATPGTVVSNGTTTYTFQAGALSNLPSGGYYYARIDIFDAAQARTQGYSTTFMFTKAAVGLTTQQKMAKLFDAMERSYATYWPASGRLSDYWFDNNNAYRYYSNGGYLYISNGTLWYVINGQWTNSNTAWTQWYSWYVGP